MTIRNARPRHFGLTFLRPLRQLAWAAAALPLLGGGCSGSAPSETAADAAEATEGAGAGACQRVDDTTVRVPSSVPGVAAWTLRTETPRSLFGFDVTMTLTGEDAAGAARVAGRFRLHFSSAELADAGSPFVRATDGDPANDPSGEEVVAFYRQNLYEDTLTEGGAVLPEARYFEVLGALRDAFAGCEPAGPAAAPLATLAAGDGAGTGGVRMGRERMPSAATWGAGVLGGLASAALFAAPCVGLLGACGAAGWTGLGIGLCVAAGASCSGATVPVVASLTAAGASAANAACDAGIRVPFLEPVRACTCERELGAGAAMYFNGNRLACYNCPLGTGFEVAQAGAPDRCICGFTQGQAILPQHLVGDPATGDWRAICDGRVCVNTYTFSAGFDGKNYGSWESEASVSLGPGWGALPSNSKRAEHTACGSDFFGTYRALGSACEAGDTSQAVDGIYVGQDVIGAPKTFVYGTLSLPKEFDDRSFMPGSATGVRDLRGTTVECGGPFWCGDGQVHACSPGERDKAKGATEGRDPPTGP